MIQISRLPSSLKQDGGKEPIGKGARNHLLLTCALLHDIVAYPPLVMYCLKIIIRRAGETYLGPELPGVGPAVVKVDQEYWNFTHHQQPGQAQAHHEKVVGLRFQRGKSAGHYYEELLEFSIHIYIHDELNIFLISVGVCN